MLWTKTVLTVGIQVIERTHDTAGFVVIPRRWWNEKINIRNYRMTRCSIPLRTDFFVYRRRFVKPVRRVIAINDA